MTESQAIDYLKAVKANVIRDEGVQYLSAAFNIHTPIFSDISYNRVLREPAEIAGLGISIARNGGFDKVTWYVPVARIFLICRDGASTKVPSVPIVKTLEHETLTRLVSAAHCLGLITYISAGVTKDQIKDVVYSGNV